MEVLVEGGQGMSESRLQKLEGRTYHIDGKVAAIETQLGTQGQQLSRIEQHLLAPKPPVNYGVWVGVGITLLFGFGSLIMAGTGYVEVQLGHMRSAIDTIDTSIDKHRDDRAADAITAKNEAYSAGVLRGELTALGNLVHHMDERRHKADERIVRLEQKAAAGEVSRRAIGDYAKEIANGIQ